MVRLQRRRFEAVSEPREFGTGSRETSPDRWDKRPCCGSHLSKTAVEYILFVFCFLPGKSRRNKLIQAKSISTLGLCFSVVERIHVKRVVILKIINAGSACVHVGLSPTASEKVYLLVKTRAKQVKDAMQLFCNV